MERLYKMTVIARTARQHCATGSMERLYYKTIGYPCGGRMAKKKDVRMSVFFWP